MKLKPRAEAEPVEQVGEDVMDGDAAARSGAGDRGPARLRARDLLAALREGDRTSRQPGAGHSLGVLGCGTRSRPSPRSRSGPAPGRGGVTFPRPSEQTRAAAPSGGEPAFQTTRLRGELGQSLRQTALIPGSRRPAKANGSRGTGETDASGVPSRVSGSVPSNSREAWPSMMIPHTPLSWGAPMAGCQAPSRATRGGPSQISPGGPGP